VEATAHLTGRIIADAEHTYPEAWIVGGQVTFERPRGRIDVPTLHGFAFPGLVDMHCHIGVSASGAVTREVARAQAVRNRDAGVLLIRDAGSVDDTAWVDEEPALPRLVRAGRFLARPKRYLPGLAREVEPPQLAVAAAEEARRGSGWVKLIADWIDRAAGSESDLAPLWDTEVLRAACERVHAAGARATAHTFATEAMDGLLDAGIDCIEHGTGMTGAHMERAAASGIPVVPTLLQVGNFETFAAQGEQKFPRYAARMRDMHQRRYTHVRAMWEAGVQIFLGTDAGSTIGHGMIAAEAEELVRAHIPAPDVVAAATWRAREFLGVESLGEGASADVVIFDEDPRVDIRALSHPRAVILRGTVRDVR